jgi:hypothetical protein
MIRPARWVRIGKEDRCAHDEEATMMHARFPLPAAATPRPEERKRKS